MKLTLCDICREPIEENKSFIGIEINDFNSEIGINAYSSYVLCPECYNKVKMMVNNIIFMKMQETK